jgi:hypothetical protein
MQNDPHAKYCGDFGPSEGLFRGHGVAIRKHTKTRSRFTLDNPSSPREAARLAFLIFVRSKFLQPPFEQPYCTVTLTVVD